MESHLAVLAAGEGNSGGHRTLAEKAFETLHTAIITGRLRPGTRLPIEELAERLEMSPMPIREAVRRLDAAGLVENIPHRGARVTELSITDLVEVYEARLALEVLAIRRAAERFDAVVADQARQCLAALEGLPRDASAAVSLAHTRFHFSLYAAADSAWLLRLIRPVWETSERYCLDTTDYRQLAARDAEHHEILAGCEARAPDRAGQALHHHLTTTANSLAVALGGEPPFDAGV
ncbi:MAG TPA: GntR family transcriptional regulator [Solirubrobacteraceae bacterium]|jgi:DNA-binding GntR family transcriptional regulator|nr:GntR family transcriptional regulator [Solirubrobacteraceae bacterium]